MDEKKIPVLDHGYVRYVQSCGTDETIISAARQSTTGSFVSWDPYEKHPQGDQGLLDYMFRHGHMTPFEMCDLTVEIQAPIMTMRQFVRHRTMSLNEMSGRYTQMPDIHYTPAPDRFVRQSKTNKQGSGTEQISVDRVEDFIGCVLEEQSTIYDSYEEMIAAGVANEVARINTPISRYTRWWAKANLRNWFHFLLLRLSPDAQLEIRVYAEAISTLVRDLWPRAWGLFEEYALHAVRFSRTEMKIVHKLASVHAASSLEAVAESAGITGSKLRELIAKLDVRHG